MSKTKIWTCKIGEVPDVPHGGDAPMRKAVAAAYRELLAAEPVFIFSGWGGELTEPERAVVENREPRYEPDGAAALRAEVEKLREALLEVLRDVDLAETNNVVWPSTIRQVRAALASDRKGDLFDALKDYPASVLASAEPLKSEEE